MHNLAVIPSPDHTTAAPDRPVKRQGRCRQEVLEEVVSGFFWIYLDLPPDITGIEIEGLTHRLIGRIRNGADEAVIAVALSTHQRCEYDRPANVDAIRKLAQQIVAAVKGC